MTRERTRRTPTPTAPAPEAGRAPADAAQASSEPPAMTARPASQLVILLADATVDMRAAMTPLGANITGWAQDAVGAVNEFAMLFPEIAAYARGSSRARNPDTTEVRDQLVLVQYGEAERVFAELCHRISQRAATLSVPDAELLDQMDLGARLFEENIARADSTVVGHGLWVPLQNYRTAAQTLRQRRTGAAPTATPAPGASAAPPGATAAGRGTGDERVAGHRTRMSPQLEARRMSLIVRLTATQVYLRRAADEIGSDREGWPQTFVDAHVRFVDVFSDYRHFMHFTGADDIAYAEASFTEWHTVQAAYAGLSDVVRDRAATLPHPRGGELGRMRRCSAALRRALGADAALGGALLPFVDAVDAGLARLAGPSSSPAP